MSGSSCLDALPVPHVVLLPHTLELLGALVAGEGSVLAVGLAGAILGAVTTWQGAAECQFSDTISASCRPGQGEIYIVTLASGLEAGQ